METFTQPKITGYRQLTEEDAVMMNRIKAVATEVGILIDGMTSPGSPSEDYKFNQRWVEIARTQLQQGFMALTRAVAKPTSF